MAQYFIEIQLTLNQRHFLAVDIAASITAICSHVEHIMMEVVILAIESQKTCFRQF
jgi:hypothetical protein